MRELHNFLLLQSVFVWLKMRRNILLFLKAKQEKLRQPNSLTNREMLCTKLVFCH